MLACSSSRSLNSFGISAIAMIRGQWSKRRRRLLMPEMLVGVQLGIVSGLNGSFTLSAKQFEIAFNTDLMIYA